LVGLRLPTHLLQVEDLWERRVGEDVIASADAPLLEAQRLHQPAELREPDVVEVTTEQSIAKLVLVHVPDANGER
jgi:hypothetical protein